MRQNYGALIRMATLAIGLFGPTRPAAVREFPR